MIRVIIYFGCIKKAAYLIQNQGFVFTKNLDSDHHKRSLTCCINTKQVGN
jgi:hypothetical protein